YHWASPIEDSQITIQSDGKPWTPKNYSGSAHGVVPMSLALSQSYNLSAVRLAQEFGLSTFINHLQKFGVTSDIPSYPSIYLGAVDMSPMEVMNIYGNFATGGFKYPVKSIRSVVDANGHSLERYSLSVQPTIDPASAYALNYGLQQVMSSGTGRSAYNSLPRNLNLAGKSGTTNDTRDSWFAGYSGNYMTVVWLGLDDNKVTGLTGSSGALPVWTNVMKQLRQKPVNLAQPNEIEWHWLDRYTGKLTAQGCDGAMYIPISRHALPNQATACGISHYATEPYTIDSEPSPEDEEEDDLSRYIQESETEIEREVAKQTRIIASGSYSQ
ncbi:MAG: penicillin-binding transpeptidase domain-containing protein, partial [Acinetobacter sp.]